MNDSMSQVERRKNTGRESQQVDAADHPHAARWLRETARRDPIGYLRLTGPNRRRLEAIYGRPTLKADGKNGWAAGWTLTEFNLSWIILTGEDGTLFRLRLPGGSDDHLSDPRVGVGITRFLQSLYEALGRDFG